MSTPLTLSLADQQRLAATSVALLSPLAYPDADAWRRAVCGHMRDLLKADKVIVVLPGEGRADLFTEDHDRAAMDEYPHRIQSVADTCRMFERLRMIGAGTRRMWYDDMDAFYRSAYWNEFALPQGAYDSITASVQVGSTAQLADHAQIIVNHGSPRAVPFGDHEVGLARLLLPALQAGALAHRRLDEVRHAFTSLVDALPHGGLVFDADGNEVHRNPAAAGLLASTPDALDVATLAGRMARGSAGRRAGGGRTTCPAVAKVGRFVLRATVVGAEMMGRDGATLVTIEATGGAAGTAALPSLEALRERFGLTAQQARIALLLAERRSTAEIAVALFISIHTVRRHTEQVFQRLGVACRADIARAIQAAGAKAGGGSATGSASDPPA